ncbi:Uncharacterised protein [Streptococcus acidominimus]|uniref:Uncharacterized protein n=1 Tax=Streptococcus acidominimus TaxID=1326 RepID=A0A380IHS9_STRAI|nr:Uncharacterised protein [Streptococcus acidominimus]
MKRKLIISIFEIIAMDIMIFIFIHFQNGTVIGGFLSLILFHLVVAIHLVNRFNQNQT